MKGFEITIDAGDGSLRINGVLKTQQEVELAIAILEALKVFLKEKTA